MKTPKSVDITGSTVTCDVCETVIEPDANFRIFSGALCAEGIKPHPKTGLTRPVRTLKKFVYLVVCGSEECGTTIIGRLWRGVG
jgi:hypothetical protein